VPLPADLRTGARFYPTSPAPGARQLHRILRKAPSLDTSCSRPGLRRTKIPGDLTAIFAAHESASLPKPATTDTVAPQSRTVRWTAPAAVANPL
jgi:hypothetical protein